MGDEQRGLGGRYWQPNRGELAWHDGQVGVGESRSRVQRATATVDLVVQKVQFAGAAPSFLTIQTDLNSGLCLRGLADARMSVRNVICLAHIQVHVDRIERDNASKRPRTA